MRKFQNLLIILIISILNTAKSQDTLILRNNTLVVCTITKLYAERIEYLNVGDTVKRQYYSYRKNDVMMIRYAGGKTDTFNTKFITSGFDDTSLTGKEQYALGFGDGFNRYKPTEEHWSGVGAGIGNFIFPYGAFVIPLVYSASKVPVKKIRDEKFLTNNHESYRRGYLDGAGKRRRNAVWSAYGITTGTCVVGIGLLIYAAFY